MRGMRTCTCGELANENTATALGLTTHHGAQAPSPSAERVISDNTRAVDGEYRAQPNAPDASLCVAGASLFLLSVTIKAFSGVGSKAQNGKRSVSYGS